MPGVKVVRTTEKPIPKVVLTDETTNEKEITEETTVVKKNNETKVSEEKKDEDKNTEESTERITKDEQQITESTTTTEAKQEDKVTNNDPTLGKQPVVGQEDTVNAISEEDNIIHPKDEGKNTEISILNDGSNDQETTVTMNTTESEQEDKVTNNDPTLGKQPVVGQEDTVNAISEEDNIIHPKEEGKNTGISIPNGGSNEGESSEKMIFTDG
ncbi:hypothetical protein Smp_089470 [Schistosoma mansoni]|uniref:hypothetical protein n=1 Tax=Schistosoma mansoni TaxID=6183 RepID=UPI0001A61CD1|nr:hypothetical protein Smp_089470 [Schistosoma mansoni]|eukprot:XP_018649648.1 hypothetical protein Smp_089470 [Schistosoma mansoni]